MSFQTSVGPGLNSNTAHPAYIVELVEAGPHMTGAGNSQLLGFTLQFDPGQKPKFTVCKSGPASLSNAFTVSNCRTRPRCAASEWIRPLANASSIPERACCRYLCCRCLHDVLKKLRSFTHFLALHGSYRRLRHSCSDPLSRTESESLFVLL